MKRPPTRGVKQNLKPNAYKQWEPLGVTTYLLYNGQRLSLTSKLKPIGVGAAKASLNRAPKFVELDPKASDLGMSRLKVR